MIIMDAAMAMTKVLVLIVAQLIAAIAAMPVSAQEKAGGVSQQKHRRSSKSSYASTGRSATGTPASRRSGYASLGGDASQKQPSSIAVSPLLGGPRNYEDSYLAAVGGQAGFDATAAHQNENYGLTPEELTLARQYVADGGRSSTINALGVNSIGDDANVIPKKLGGGKPHSTSQRSLSVSDFGYTGYTNTNGSLTGTHLYRSPW